MKSRTISALGVLACIAVVVMYTAGAFALPSIHYIYDPEAPVPKFGAVLNYSNKDVDEYDNDGKGYYEYEIKTSINDIASMHFSGDTYGNMTGVSYDDAVLYAEAVSDPTYNNPRGGLIQGEMVGGVGQLKVLGKVVSSRTDEYLDPVRSYAEATADAYVTFRVQDTNPNMETVRTRFWIETDLAMWNSHDYGGPMDADDRYVNWATYGGLLQDERPAGNFDLTVTNPALVTDEDGYLINLVFDDPARPEQYDATAPDDILSGRGDWIPEDEELPAFMNSNRTRLYDDDENGYVNWFEMQEPLLQDPDLSNPANNDLATNPIFSLGNVTFNDGMRYEEWWFDAEVDREYVIYVQLSANITNDGGINGKFGSSDNVEDFAMLYYGLDVVPEPGTIILIGIAVAGLAAIARKRLTA